MDKNNQPEKIISNPFHFKDENGKHIKVTADGSLGILAAGYKGVIVWKQELAESLQKQNKEVNDEKA